MSSVKELMKVYLVFCDLCHTNAASQHEELALRANALSFPMSKARGLPRVLLNVHALVLTAFVGPRPEGLTCNHIDGNSLNNVVGNLEWVTSQENMRHAHALNLIVPFLPRGARNAMTKLTDAEVMEIRRLYAEGMRNKDLSRQFSVSPGNISMIVHRRKWTHLP
jgi:hypothetical protein